MNVLLVDDDAKIRALLRRMLEPEGYTISEVGSAEEAVRAVEQLQPAVAFCDMHMGGANGLWLAEQIRAVSPATAVVLATGDTEVPPTETFRPGVVAYVLKPLSRRRILDAAAKGTQWSADARRRGVQGQRRLDPPRAT
jgi:CheY-like chemotaxis protein